MKIIFDYCRQKSAYQDSFGECLIELEQGDNADDIIKDFTQPRQWWEQYYHTPKRVNEYTYEKYDHPTRSVKNVTVTGDLILFKTKRAYLD